ncbi:MAG: hypothetical protein QM808_15985 [Steroidobacteraceae bacterium]
MKGRPCDSRRSLQTHYGKSQVKLPVVQPMHAQSHPRHSCMQAASTLSINAIGALRNIPRMSLCWLAAVCLVWRNELLTLSLPQIVGMLLMSSLAVTLLGMVATTLRNRPSVAQALACQWQDPLQRFIPAKLLLAGVTAIELLFALSLVQLLKPLLD